MLWKRVKYGASGTAPDRMAAQTAMCWGDETMKRIFLVAAALMGATAVQAQVQGQGLGPPREAQPRAPVQPRVLAQPRVPAQVRTQVQAQKTVPVTVDNFTRAESDHYLAADGRPGQLGKFKHARAMASVDNQPVVRYNRDVLVSSAIFDFEAGPVTITLPDPGKRFMSILAINEDHYTPIAEFGGGTYRLSKDSVGTRYAAVALRTFADPNDPKDMAAAHALQDAVTVDQPGGPGKFEAPNWDRAGLSKVRNSLLVLGSTIQDFRGAFGKKGEVDPIRHLIGTAAGWGGNPELVAIYLNVTPPKNDGKMIYRLSVPADVPVDGFWGISLYNARGYFQKNRFGAYNLNNVIANKNADGSVTVQFGGCDGKIANCLPIMQGWNYTVRLYRPRAEIINRTWKFPEPQPVN